MKKSVQGKILIKAALLDKILFLVLPQAVELPSLLTWHQFQSTNLLLINNKSLSITKSKSLKWISKGKLDLMIISLCLNLFASWALYTYAYAFAFNTFINHAACIYLIAAIQLPSLFHPYQPPPGLTHQPFCFFQGP